jgi:hypothetical protein
MALFAGSSVFSVKRLRRELAGNVKWMRQITYAKLSA